MLKIVLTGPESTGKTTLARQLAEHFQVPWVPEYARQYIDQLKRPYEQADLLSIAQTQWEQIQLGETQNPHFLICDTSMLVLKIWSEFKYASCDPWILNALDRQSVDLYVLCGAEIEWQADEQRENPDDRQDLYRIYLRELRALKRPFAELQGNQAERLNKAIAILNCLRKIP